MEPQLPIPRLSPENTLPIAQRTGESFNQPRTPEAKKALIEQGAETREVFLDDPSKGDPAQVVAAVPTLPTISPVQLPATTQTTTVADDNPLVAADDDLIEKEWVTKAKRVVSETKNDPYAQDIAISRLQADYLQKRYGKIIKQPSEG